MKRDIILVMGKSSTGKDYIVSQCVEHLGYKKAVSYSSRSIRPNEVEGVDYFFRSHQEVKDMIDNGEVYEYTSYKTNTGELLYAFGIDSFVDDEINLAIMNTEGLAQVLNTELRDRIAIIYIEASDKIRYYRYNKRLGGIENMTTEQKAEGYDRMNRDYRDFREFEDWLCDNCDSGEIPVLELNNDYNDGYSFVDKISKFVNEVSDEV